MNRSQLKTKAYRRTVRNRFRNTYGKDMWLEFYLNWLRKQRGDYLMPKLIDSAKPLEWCNEKLSMAGTPDIAQYADGRRTVIELLVGELESGSFAPTPVQPDTPTTGTEILLNMQAKEKVDHIMKVYLSHMKQHLDIKLGDKVKTDLYPTIGKVLRVNYDNQTAYCRFGPASPEINYELELPFTELEVITDDQPTKEA